MTCVTLAVSFLGEVPFDEAGRAHSVSRARYARRDERFSRLIIIDVMAATSINYFGRDLAGVAPSSRAPRERLAQFRLASSRRTNPSGPPSLRAVQKRTWIL